MKVLLLQGSPRKGGNSELLLKEMVKVFGQYGVESEIVEIGQKDIRGCISCGYCSSHDECVFKDEVNAFAKKFEEADGLVVASPVYYASPNGTVISFLDRLFHSTSFSKRYKVGAAFAIARRGGTTASFDVLNKYFTISGMPVASGDYWNNGFGREKGEIKEDLEGLRNARIVAQRMVFLMNAIKDAKAEYPNLLEEEPRIFTHFIKNKQ
jgi:multimeric flavodoxin WrbA